MVLTAEQMAQLTSDIVWLVEQTVTLPDGSTQRVLVPQVYPAGGGIRPNEFKVTAIVDGRVVPYKFIQ